MDKLKNKKIGLLAILLVFLIIVIGFIVYQAKTSKNSNNQEQNSNTIVDNSVSNEVSDEIQIPKQDKKVSKKEKKIISKYFKGIWMLQNGEKILVIDSGKRFCCIDVNNNTKQYGTYSVKDKTSSKDPEITLKYLSDNSIVLSLVQGDSPYLKTSDSTEKYVKYEDYYLGTAEGIDGVFNSSNAQIPESKEDISKEEKQIISKYFKGVWILQNGEKILVIDSGKRFCCIDVNNNTKEYGTYSVLDETAASVPKIILEYSSGNNVKLFRIQNNYSFLETGDTTERYVEHEGYYFGLVKSDAGVFSK